MLEGKEAPAGEFLEQHFHDQARHAFIAEVDLLFENVRSSPRENAAAEN